MSVQQVLEIIQKRGIRIWTDGQQLHYRAPVGALDEALRATVRQHKADLIAVLQQGILQAQERDREVRAAGFLVLASGCVYERRTGTSSALYILEDGNGTYTVWRGAWRPGEVKPYSEKVLGTGLTFAAALEKAKRYMGKTVNVRKHEQKPRRKDV